jgi:citronellyl-CoA dehydrogenase
MGGLTMGILVHTDMATPIIQKIGTEEQKEEFLRPALSGDKVAALAISEPGAGSDVAGMRTTAQKDGDEYVISGQKTWITNGTRADFITLAARTDPDDRYGGISLFLFPTETEGFEVGKKLDKIGNHTSDTAELFFDDCRIPEKYLLGDEGAGFYYIMKNFQGERLTAALTALGSADIAIEETKAYCKDRQAFGKSISDMQVTQHRFADMETELQSARDLTYHAADLFDRGVDAQREISMAKLKAGETAKDVLDECLQLHGGMGYMEETPIARAWRDIRVLTIAGGTSAIMKEIIANASGL